VRTCTVAVLLVLVVGGCAGSEESSSVDAIDTTASTVAPTSIVLSTTVTEATATTTTPSPTSATAPAPTTTTSTTEAAESESTIVLRTDGLGVVPFGTGIDEALVVLTGLLGPPTSHELHTDVWPEESSYGSFHEVKWKGLRLEFVDWDIDWMPLDSPVFSYWTTGRSLRTPEGVGPGSLWADTAATYGDAAKAWAEDCGEYSGVFHFFSIELDGEGCEHIAGYAYFGWLTDDPSDPASSVAQMEAGREAFPQGC